MSEVLFDDIFSAARRVADTVLYEGYVLYPYRASSRKNQTRWQFGVLMPPGYHDASERTASRTELVFEAKPDAVLHLRVRFLHVQHRTGGDQPEWDETIERQVEVAVPVGQLPHTEQFACPASVTEQDGVRRECAALDGAIIVTASELPGPYGALRLRVDVENRTAGEAADRDLALRGALVAAHALLALERGRFVSMTDPPEWAAPEVKACTNEGTWPVLVGTESVALSSPIILGDYPQIAPESVGDLYDATEIDEILTLRTMALTDAEKAEARATDPRAAAVIDQVDDLPQEHLDRLHGALRYLRRVQGDDEPETIATPHDHEQPADLMKPSTPWWDPGADASVSPATDAIVVDGVRIARGSRVRLRPGRRRTDAQDAFLHGKTATVEAVLFDVDGEQHVGVTPDDDPEYAELQRMQGRFLYFSPEEVEPVLALEEEELGDRQRDERSREEPAAAERGPRRIGDSRVLIAGVGNIFLSDDAFGVEVVRALAGVEVPDGVKIADFGIRGVHLAYELLDGYDVLVVVDAAPRGEQPGTVSLVEVDQSEVPDASQAVADGERPMLDAHGMEPGAILQMLGSLGGRVGKVLVVACEPQSVEEGLGLSAAVQAAVPNAVELVQQVLSEHATTTEVSR